MPGFSQCFQRKTVLFNETAHIPTIIEGKVTLHVKKHHTRAARRRTLAIVTPIALVAGGMLAVTPVTARLGR
jgi:hypothetical protein